MATDVCPRPCLSVLAVIVGRATPRTPHGSGASAPDTPLMRRFFHTREGSFLGFLGAETETMNEKICRPLLTRKTAALGAAPPPV